MRRGGRRYWWSLRSKPVSGWHVQQLIKLGAAATLPGERFCILDSDVAFFRPFDLSRYRRPHSIPAFYAPAAVAADTLPHAEWIRSTHRLLGLGQPEFPADDFIGHVIPWDQRAVRAMLARIENVTGHEWADALCRTREFSEYLLYGYFVRNDSVQAAQHRPSTQLPCVSYWEPAALDLAGIRRFIENADDHSAAFSAASLSKTPVQLVRAALAGHAAEQERLARTLMKVQAS